MRWSAESGQPPQRALQGISLKRLGGRVWRFSRLLRAAAVMFWIAPHDLARGQHAGDTFVAAVSSGRPLYRPSGLGLRLALCLPASAIVIVFPGNSASISSSIPLIARTCGL